MVTRIVKSAGARKPGAGVMDSVGPLARQATRGARKAARKVQAEAARTASGLLGLHGERMSKVDTAWLRMDSPSNLMMIVGVWTLRPRVGYEALCERVQDRLLKFNRFRQRVEHDAAGVSWVEDGNFDLSAHVVRETLPRRRGVSAQSALQDRVGELAMQPLDSSRPLWRCTWSRTTTAAARSSCASTIASLTASR